MAVLVAMLAPDGREWVAGSVMEVNDLLAQGYVIKGSGTPAGTDRLTAAPQRPVNQPVTPTGQSAPAGKGDIQ